MAWTYKREEREFQTIPEGRYRVRVKEADKAISKSGNDMLVLQLEVSGSTQILYHYIVFMEDRPEITNRMLTQFFDSFPGIQQGDLNIAHWIGKTGAAQVKHDTYDGRTRAKIHYFIAADKATDIAPWVEPPHSTSGSTATTQMPADADGFMQLPPDSDLPDFV